MRIALAALAISIIASGTAIAEVRGMAGVPAADVLAIEGAFYRLYGIDAPERLQPCYVDGKVWACGPVAVRQLEIFVANEPAVCVETGESAGKYGEWAVCTVGDSDLAEAMVRTGMALALREQTDKYVAAEEEAKAAGAGIWKSIFIEPWIYRKDAALIDEKIAERLRNTPLDANKIDAIRVQVERALTSGDGGIEVFQGFQIERNSSDTTEREAFVGEVRKGYLTEPVMERLPDNWLDYDTWQKHVVSFAHRQALNVFWDDLAMQPRQEYSAPDAETYLKVLLEQAAAIVQTGKQPVLLVQSTGNPPWIGDWLGSADERPEALEVINKENIKTDRYYGTLNGIDIFEALPPDGESFLVPHDLLQEVRYGPNADGRMIDISFRGATEEASGSLLVRFALGIEWQDGDVVVLTYPPVEIEAEYE